MMLFTPPPATFSPCGKYRYTLRRHLGSPQFPTFARTVCWIMLNPSTADAEQDDPTIRKCMGFTKRWNYHDMIVVNAYAWRSTDPKVLPSLADPVGPDNDKHIVGVTGTCDLIVCAWGGNIHPSRQADLASLLNNRELRALKINADGTPMHPLYVGYEVRVEEDRQVVDLPRLPILYKVPRGGR